MDGSMTEMMVMNKKAKILIKNFRLTLEGNDFSPSLWSLTSNRPFITDRIKHPYHATVANDRSKHPE
jgi:hypothetical protein